VAGAVVAAICALADRDWAVCIVALLATLSVAFMILVDYPQLDRLLSGREAVSITCLPQTSRSQRYSLEYYAGRKLADCK
jgi:hypothetical protein